MLKKVERLRNSNLSYHLKKQRKGEQIKSKLKEGKE